MSPEKPRYKAGLGAWLRDLRLNPSLLSALSEEPCESPWQRRAVGQLTVLMPISLLVEVGLGGINSEDA